jgi:hypothetical protein
MPIEPRKEVRTPLRAKYKDAVHSSNNKKQKRDVKINKIRANNKSINPETLLHNLTDPSGNTETASNQSEANY